MGVLRGTSIGERLVGMNTNDMIYGLDGSDTLVGSGGDDQLFGGAGQDFLYGDVVPGVHSGVGFGPGHVTVPASAGNRTMAKAIDITHAFRLFQEADVANSIMMPHVSINESGTGHIDYYKLTVNKGTNVTLDIDHSQFVNTTLDVIDDRGYEIASNDDALVPDLDAGSTTITDSALTFTAPETGTYYFVVGGRIDPDNIGPIPGGTSYTLQVAVVDTPDQYAGTGNDYLDGGTGADAMFGGKGNDLYVVDNVDDKVYERAGEGSDRILTTVIYALLAGQAVEKLTTRSSLDTHSFTLTGNEFANILMGGAGDDVLNGGAGGDSMYGRSGDDTYYVDNSHDRVFEKVGEGNDTIITSANFTLRAGQEVETLKATAYRIKLTGNEFDNTLIAIGGSDTLDGGAGADTMIASNSGYNTFYVDNSGDKVIDPNDSRYSYEYGTIYTTIDYALTDNQGIRTLAAADPDATTRLHLSGNQDANILVGGAGDDVLNGGGVRDTDSVRDTVTGYGGADTFVLAAPVGNEYYQGYYYGSSNALNITDFTNSTNAVHDTVQLSRALFPALAAGSSVTSAEFATVSFAYNGNETPDTRLLYTNSNFGTLFYDADGSGSALPVAIATFTGSPTLSAADFTIVG